MDRVFQEFVQSCGGDHDIQESFRYGVCQGHPVRIKDDAQMHHGQSSGEAKNDKGAKLRGRFKNVAEIGGNKQDA